MYLGRVVEVAPADDPVRRAAPSLYRRAAATRSRASTAAARRFSAIEGEIPSPINPPAGCHFHPRCPHAFDRCRIERPALAGIAPGQDVACHLNTGRGLTPANETPQGD